VERLGDEAIRVLSVAAVVGREFEISMLAEIADVDEDSLVDLLETAVSAAVLIESDVADQYRFGHALIQHSLYEELSPTRRQRTHQRIAQALEAQTSGDDLARLAELAHHWVAATRPAHLDKALGYVRRAGDAARDALAPEDAVRWYEQALDLVARQSPADECQRAELLAALGTAQRQAARPEHRDTLFEAASLAQQLSMDETLIRAALGFIAGGTHVQVGDNRAKAVIRAALDRIGPDSMPIRARLLAGLASAHDAGTEWRDCQRLMLEAVDIARRVDDEVVFLEVFDLAYYMLATPDRRDQHLDDTERALAIADRLGDPVLRIRIRNLMMWARYQQADIAGADAVLSEIQTLTETVGLAYLRYRHAYFVTGRLLLAGRATEAEKANERLLELGTAGDIPEAMAIFGALLYAIRSHQGRLSEIADLFVDAARNNPSIPQLRSAATLLLSEVGRIDEACERLAAEKANGFDYPYDMLWLAAMANVTDAAATVKDRPAAQALCERLAPFAAHVISPAGIYVMGAIARPLARAAALLADYDQAERWFEMAHDIHGRLQAPFWIALGQLDHADLCLVRRAEGDVARARELASAAAATSSEYGCAHLTERAASLLAAI
jgi:tetratricopeptide (TPR) repeat protein